MTEHNQKCPNCGRNLTENELYCHFCEMDLSKLRKKHHRQQEKH